MTPGSLDRVVRWPGYLLVTPVVSLLLGCFFIFVWAPHPWGWFGIDQYHYLALDLAAGKPFETLDVPWGYGYFLAVFYRVFGPTPLPPLLAQAVLNAFIPALVFGIAARLFDRRVAALSAVLVSLLSFNTVYASTESTDAVCTFVFVLMVWCFTAYRLRAAWWPFAVVGALCGIAAQFRPNLVLLPLLLCALHWWLGPRRWRRAGESAVLLLAVALVLAPWTVRNYQLTQQFLPTSTHGGVQLWYGSLQTGPYLQSRAHNPRSIFETPPFDYTSLIDVPLLVDVRLGCAPAAPRSVVLIYRVDGGGANRVTLVPTRDKVWSGVIPPTGRAARFTYTVDVSWPPDVSTVPVWTAPPTPGDAFVYFASGNHLGDLDVDSRLFDLFDVIRLLRYLAWEEPIRDDGLDLDRNGATDDSDLRLLIRRMLWPLDRGEPSVDRVDHVEASESSVRLRFADGSTLVVPREWGGVMTDVAIDGEFAAALLSSRARVTEPFPRARVPMDEQCLRAGEITVNDFYFRRQPHEMRRYTALALDNIRRGPAAYAASVLYRALRLFVIQGTGDRSTAQQFDGSAPVYAAATAVSAAYLLAFIAGAWMAWRRGDAVWIPLALIAYVPATIAFVLTNMRYTITVQPLMLIFVAVTCERTLIRLGFLSELAADRARSPLPK